MSGSPDEPTGGVTVIDVHAHLHPCFDTARALTFALENLRALGGPEAWRVCCLAEREGMDSFCALRANPPAGWDVGKQGAGQAYELQDGQGQGLWLVRGCQIETRERLEVSGLLVEHPGSGGDLDARGAVKHILQEGGMPVLHWALGKWSFARKRIVASLIDEFGPNLLLSDSSTRPVGWPLPGVMCARMQGGGGVLAGSDPLPMPQEERMIGSYATSVNAPLDATSPERRLREMLIGERGAPRRVGRRDSLGRAFCRQVSYRLA